MEDFTTALNVKIENLLYSKFKLICSLEKKTTRETLQDIIKNYIQSYEQKNNIVLLKKMEG